MSVSIVNTTIETVTFIIKGGEITLPNMEVVIMEEWDIDGNCSSYVDLSKAAWERLESKLGHKCGFSFAHPTQEGWTFGIYRVAE
jgi:hypothetical protein